MAIILVRLYAQIVKHVLEEARRACKALRHDRYKYSILVTYGQKAGQETIMSSKCLWDPSTDDMASVIWQNETVFCSCQVS